MKICTFPSVNTKAYVQNVPHMAGMACLVLLLAGCVGAGARAIVHAEKVDTAATNYINDRWEIRQEIRRRCEMILWNEVDALVAAQDFEAARMLMALNYPRLLSLEIVQRYREGDLSGLDAPWGCQVSGLPE